MKNDILAPYLKSKTKKGEAAPQPTAAMVAAAELAAQHPEELLRLATVMKAAHNRKQAKA